MEIRKLDTTLDIVNIFSLAKCSIISNSTLSWWGAYLSNGKIYSPVMSLWEPDLMIPDDWEQIYSGEIKPLTHNNKFKFQTSFESEGILNSSIYNAEKIINN